MIDEFKKAEGVDLSTDKMALQRLKAVSYTHLDVYKRQSSESFARSSMEMH